MNLYIKVENSQTVDHPVSEQNLFQVFGTIPENYEPFVAKVPNKAYKFTDPQTYEKVNGAWTHIMTTSEIYDTLSDEEKYKWSTKPTDNKDYVWSLTDRIWVEMPPMPQDGKTYAFRIKLAKWDEYDPITEKFISDGIPLNIQK